MALARRPRGFAEHTLASGEWKREGVCKCLSLPLSGAAVHQTEYANLRALRGEAWLSKSYAKCCICLSRLPRGNA